jgi:hypothetical protein
MAICNRGCQLKKGQVMLTGAGVPTMRMTNETHSFLALLALDNTF